MALVYRFVVFFFFFNDTATTEIYTLSLHDALPILKIAVRCFAVYSQFSSVTQSCRSEEHTSELQSPPDLVCRLLLEKKKKNTLQHTRHNQANVLVTLARSELRH